MTFRFKSITSDDFFEINSCDQQSKIIDTIPGWAHDVINKSNSEAKILVWANELFDEKKPDTIIRELNIQKQ